MDRNITTLKELSNKINPVFKKLNDIYQKINESKDKLKEKIHNIFNIIRTGLNKRERKLYVKIEVKYKELFFNDELKYFWIKEPSF